MLSTLIKAGIRRPRPLPPEVRVVVAPLGGTSFPSGHVLTYVGFYGFLGFLLAEHLRDGALRNASVASIAGLLAIVGPSRIQQGHHWTTDVVASYLLGTAYLFALVELYRVTTPRSLPSGCCADDRPRRSRNGVTGTTGGANRGPGADDPRDLERQRGRRRIRPTTRLPRGARRSRPPSSPPASMPRCYESSSEADTARRVAAALEAEVATIVAAGGDGTVRSMAFQLLGREVALGILPMGTAMNVARSLDIPLDLDGAAAVLAAGHVRSIDVGEVRSRPFLEVASIGLGAEVLAGATEAGEGRFRRALTIAPARHRAAADTRPAPARWPGGPRPRAVDRGRQRPASPDVASSSCREARLDDGRFDVLLYEGFGPLRIAADIARVLLGRANDPRFRRYRAATVRISSHRPLPVRLDSQDVGTTPVELGDAPRSAPRHRAAVADRRPSAG